MQLLESDVYKNPNSEEAWVIENIFSGYIDGLGDAVEQGLVKAVGVSNYNGILLPFTVMKINPCIN